MIKIVYGPPPPDDERIEDVEPEGEDCFREEEVQQPPPLQTGRRSKKVR